MLSYLLLFPQTQFEISAIFIFLRDRLIFNQHRILIVLCFRQLTVTFNLDSSLLFALLASNSGGILFGYLVHLKNISGVFIIHHWVITLIINSIIDRVQESLPLGLGLCFFHSKLVIIILYHSVHGLVVFFIHLVWYGSIVLLGQFGFVHLILLSHNSSHRIRKFDGFFIWRASTQIKCTFEISLWILI